MNNGDERKIHMVPALPDRLFPWWRQTTKWKRKQFQIGLGTTYKNPTDPTRGYRRRLKRHEMYEGGLHRLEPRSEGSLVFEWVRPEFPVENSRSGSDSQGVGKWLAAVTRYPRHNLKDTRETCSLPLIQSESKADVVLIVFQSSGQEKTKYVIHVVVFKGKITTHVQQTLVVARARDSICNHSWVNLINCKWRQSSSSAKMVTSTCFLQCFPLFSPWRAPTCHPVFKCWSPSDMTWEFLFVVWLDLCRGKGSMP